MTIKKQNNFFKTIYPIKTNKKAFTLVEIMVVVLIIGVLGGVLYTIFFTNWFAFEDRIARANLWSEADVIFETMSSEARNMRQIDVFSDTNSKSAFFRYDLNLNKVPVATYTINNNGQMTVNRGSGNVVLTDHLDFTKSSFVKVGSALKVTLVLKDQLIPRTIAISTSTEIFPRN